MLSRLRCSPACILIISTGKKTRRHLTLSHISRVLLAHLLTGGDKWRLKERVTVVSVTVGMHLGCVSEEVWSGVVRDVWGWALCCRWEFSRWMVMLNSSGAVSVAWLPLQSKMNVCVSCFPECVWSALSLSQWPLCWLDRVCHLEDGLFQKMSSMEEELSSCNGWQQTHPCNTGRLANEMYNLCI